MQRLRRDGGSILETLALLLIIFFIMLPIVWLALTAIKPQEKAYTTDIVFPPTLDNFRIIFSDTSVIINEGTARERGSVGRNMVPNVFNSIIVSGATILIAIPLATIAAYAFSRYVFLGNRALLIWILTTQFIPAIVVAIPFFALFRSVTIFGKPLLGSQLGLIIVNMSIVLPYAIWMIKGFVDALPNEIEEAAYVDGCNDFQVLFFISLPLIRPGIRVGRLGICHQRSARRSSCADLLSGAFHSKNGTNSSSPSSMFDGLIELSRNAHNAGRLDDHQRSARRHVGTDGCRRLADGCHGADLLSGAFHSQECCQWLDDGRRQRIFQIIEFQLHLRWLFYELAPNSV